MKDVFTELVYAMEKKADTVLVTIVEENGSVPRGTGTMMLIGKKGRLAGTVGGGSVERCAMEKSARLLETKENLLHEFILHENASEDIGMVCGGDVTLWFLYIAHDNAAWNALAGKVLEKIEAHLAGWLVFDLKSGRADIMEKEENSYGCSAQEKTKKGDADSLKKVINDAKIENTKGRESDNSEARDMFGIKINTEIRDALKVEEHTGKRVDDFFSVPLPLGERVIVFGAGHIARALVPLIAGVGFRPVVFDCRAEYANPEIFPDAEQIISGDFEKIDNYIDVKPDDYIVVMTSGHSHDFVIQEQVLRKKTAYVGVIGSRRKTASVNARLMEAGIGEEVTKQVHTPIGTAIKAVTPAEIAVSIAGELIYVRAMLREGAHQKSGSLEFEGGTEQKTGCPMH